MTRTVTAPLTQTSDWWLCPECRMLIYRKRLARNLFVCPACGRHERLGAPQRLAQLLDRDTAEQFAAVAASGDPLRFTDLVPYQERLRQAREKTGLDEAVVCARGAIHGFPVIVAVMDFGFLGGSMGAAVGDLIAEAADAALRERVPFLIVTASGGARMQEGAISLMQMAKVSASLGRLDAAGVLTISLVSDPTFGGVAASIATIGDVIIAEPGARLGFAGPRVIEQTIRQPVPEGFQTAEHLFRRGMVDGVYHRAGLRSALARVLGAARPGLLAVPDSPAVADTTVVLIRDQGMLPVRHAWQTVRSARDPRRPTALDYLDGMVSDFEELHGDRLAADCPAIVGGLGRLAGQPVVVIGHQKGHTAVELSARNYGMAMPSGYRKAARLMRLAAKLRLPVLTLVDTPGAYPGAEAEEGGQAVAIAENLRLMARLPVPIVATITGEGGSGGALAIALADRVLALSGAVYSVISPEGCAAILWRDANAAPQAAAALRLDAGELLRLGVVDAVVPEPEGGAHLHPGAAVERLGAALAATLAELAEIDPARLVEQRHQRFRAFTAVGQADTVPGTHPESAGV